MLMEVTLPVTATFCVVAPVDACVILPEYKPALAPVKRTSIVVDETAPLLGVSVTVVPYSLLPVRIAKPAGAAMVRSAVRPDADTV